MADLMIYEQPLNELIRVVLHAEYLLQLIDQLYAEHQTVNHSRILIKEMNELTILLDRSDLKAKLSKEFTRLIASLSNFRNTPHVNQPTLDETLEQLKKMTQTYLNTRGKIAENLRSNDFLSQIRQYSSIIAGDSPIDIPRYFNWLNQSIDFQKKYLAQWLNEFKEIREVIQLFLDVVRRAATPEPQIAQKGFYLQNLNPQVPLQLIRIGLAPEKMLYPKISAGPHRMSVTFMTMNCEGRSQQTTEDVPFELTCCTI